MERKVSNAPRKILPWQVLCIPGPSLAPRGQMCPDHPRVIWLACLHPWLTVVRTGGWALAVLQGMGPQGGG